MFSDPLSVTYNGSAKSLPRVSVGRQGTRYRTADGEFELRITTLPNLPGGGLIPAVDSRLVTLTRKLPDPTPSDVFDAMRNVYNSYSVIYGFDTGRYEASVDLPRLRTALLGWLDTGTNIDRIVSGEQ